jgi:hypothetical protein
LNFVHSSQLNWGWHLQLLVQIMLENSCSTYKHIVERISSLFPTTPELWNSKFCLWFFSQNHLKSTQRVDLRLLKFQNLWCTTVQGSVLLSKLITCVHGCSGPTGMPTDPAQPNTANVGKHGWGITKKPAACGMALISYERWEMNIEHVHPIGRWPVSSRPLVWEHTGPGSLVWWPYPPTCCPSDAFLSLTSVLLSQWWWYEACSHPVVFQGLTSVNLARTTVQRMASSPITPAV